MMDSVDIEVVLQCKSKANIEKAIELCEKYLRATEVLPNTVINKLDEPVSTDIETIIIGDCQPALSKLDLDKSHVQWYVYKLNQSGSFMDCMQMDGEQENRVLATSWMLPSSDFHDLWENLIYESNIKQNLLRYVSTTVLFSDKGINPNIVCSNRVVLLHGPPGTGKTSLCKALAHKLAIRLRRRYTRAQLVEINSHSLFSKWFSESGKLVASMFGKIREIVEEPDTLVFLLIDEVESLAHARQKCMSGSEPSDSVRVVNALLTEVDQMKRFSNVLILTTSNMTGAIDVAFVDRADIKQYIGLPSSAAIYQIYYSCLKELMRAEVIVPAEVLLPANALSLTDFEQNCCCERSKTLKQLSDASQGLSGRALRKVPFVAHALFLDTSEEVSLSRFLDAMATAVAHLKKERLYFEN